MRTETLNLPGQICRVFSVLALQLISLIGRKIICGFMLHELRYEALRFTDALHVECDRIDRLLQMIEVQVELRHFRRFLPG